MNENGLDSSLKEGISALVDGCLQEDAYAKTLDEMLSDVQSVNTWHAYHVIGDVLRNSDLGPMSNDFDFLAKLERRLALEPGRPELVGIDAAISVLPATEFAIFDTNKSGANAAVFRWKMLAGFACTVLFGVVGLSLWNQTGLVSEPRLVSLDRVPATTSAVPAGDITMGPMIRDARLDELMEAHRQLGGHSALQVPAGFLRNATHKGPSR